MSTQDRHVITLILLGQIGLGIGLAIVLAIIQGRVAAWSALLGGMIAVIPNAFLAARLLAPGSGASAKALLRAAWLGELGKLLLTAALFAAVFVGVRPLSVLAVFGGYIGAQLVVFGAPLFSSGWVDGEDTKAKS